MRSTVTFSAVLILMLTVLGPARAHHGEPPPEGPGKSPAEFFHITDVKRSSQGACEFIVHWEVDGLAGKYRVELVVLHLKEGEHGEELIDFEMGRQTWVVDSSDNGKAFVAEPVLHPKLDEHAGQGEHYIRFQLTLNRGRGKTVAVAVDPHGGFPTTDCDHG